VLTSHLAKLFPCCFQRVSSLNTLLLLLLLLPALLLLQVPVVASNRIGTETWAKSSITFYGGSFISGQRGEVLAQVRTAQHICKTAGFQCMVISAAAVGSAVRYVRCALASRWFAEGTFYCSQSIRDSAGRCWHRCAAYLQTCTLSVSTILYLLLVRLHYTQVTGWFAGPQSEGAASSQDSAERCWDRCAACLQTCRFSMYCHCSCCCWLGC
jgi:hypothetical protein